MTPDLLEHICRLAGDSGLAAVFDTLKAQDTKKMLAAKTSEERDGHWRDYHAVERLQKRLNLMASEAKAKAK